MTTSESKIVVLTASSKGGAKAIGIQAILKHIMVSMNPEA
jgi:hypothetical protein